MRSLIDGAGRRRADALVVCAFVASGAAGLMYQVVWSRDLVLVFGNTTEAIGTIVTAFLAGLGLGGLAGGLLAPRLRRPLLVYGIAELAVAASALMVPTGFHLIEGSYHAAYDSLPPGQLILARLLLTMVTVTPVTFLMGLTLPLLTRHLVDSMRVAGGRLGQLYSANTFGAMAGTVLAGFVLIELLGLGATATLAAALNVLAGGVALTLSRTAPAAVAPQPPPDPTPHQPGGGTGRPWMRPMLYAATVVSGFVALALEVLWTRMLAEGTGSRIYNFVAILAVYLLGIAVGGAIYRRRGSPERDTPAALATALLGIAVSALITVPLGTGAGPAWIVSVAAMLPATILMGCAFPLTARLVALDPAHSARSVGFVYAWNTAGAIAGALTATFVLAATLGTNASILVLGAANAAVALVLMLVTGRPRRPVELRLPAAALATLLIPPLLVATGSPLVETTTQHRLDYVGLAHQHVEDRLSTVDAVAGPPSARRLYVSGTSMTYLSTDTKLMAYMPKVVRPDATDFLDICFGMGTTYRSALRLGMRTDAVDLSPTVPRMMPTFYPDATKYLNSPNGHIVNADGRNYVRLTSRRYDVISVDPPPPIQSAGTSVLYTREFYADAHHSLKPGGMMMEWLYYGVTLDELRQHLRTFRSEFPHVTVLFSPMHGGIYMLGSDADVSWNDGVVARVMDSPEALADIGDAPDYYRVAGQSWTGLLDRSRWLHDGEVDRFAGPGPMITDDHPRTEYYLVEHTLTGQFGHTTEAELRRLRPPTPS
jgi:spermidine synthase